MKKKLSNIWCPIKVKYAGKSYYPMTKKEYLIKSQVRIIRYYCTNHLLNTNTKKFLLKIIHVINSQLEYDRLKNEFYITFEHNNIKENNNPVIYDNVGDIQKNVYNFSNFKSFLIDFLNKNVL